MYYWRFNTYFFIVAMIELTNNLRAMSVFYLSESQVETVIFTASKSNKTMIYINSRPIQNILFYALLVAWKCQ